MGNAYSVIFGAGNRPRQGRAVLEILALLYVLRRLGQGKDNAAAAAGAAAGSGLAALPPSASTSAGLTPTAESGAASVHSSPQINGISGHAPSRGGSRRNSISQAGSSSSSTSVSSTNAALPVPSITGYPRVDAFLARVNRSLRRYTPLQLVLALLILVHLRDNLSVLLGLNAPHHSLVMEPDVAYSRNFSRVRMMLTSLDAATLSVQKVRFPVLRHGLMLLLAGYYTFNFRRAENKVEAFRRSMTHESIRACWEKGGTPVLAAVDRLTRKRCEVELELIPIRSPDGHDIETRLFYNKPLSSLASERALLLDFPGGGFIAMSPRHHADYLSFWARTLDLPVLSVNYRKAPEHPFPCGFEDAWYVYKAIVDSNGGVLGMNSGPSRSDAPIRLALAGDSAGGNLAAGVTIKAILSGLRRPDGLLLIYPVLDLASTNFWRESSLPPLGHVVKARPASRAQIHASTNAAHRKTQAELKMLAAKSEAEVQDRATGHGVNLPSDAVATVPPSATATSAARSADARVNEYGAPELSSRAQYTQDGVLPLKYMQLIASCYFLNGGDPIHNPLISPAIVSDAVLQHWPPTYGHVGSVDPLVDDVLRFGARINQAKAKAKAEANAKATTNSAADSRDAADSNASNNADTEPHVQVCVIPKVSHAYLHVVNFLPEAKVAVDLSATWLSRLLLEGKGQGGAAVPAAVREIAEGLPQRMKQLGLTITDCRDYQLTQPKSQDAHEAALGAEPLVSKL